jgi:aminoglycoside phosphotransferase (APT) family kinase protein
MTADQAGSAAPEPVLRDWLAAQLGTAGPFVVHPISGGNSNETALLLEP